MIRRRAIATAVVVLGTTTAVLPCAGADAGASGRDREPPRPSRGGRHRDVASPGTEPGGGEDGVLATESVAAESVATESVPSESMPTESMPTEPTGPVSGDSTVGGAPATTAGAADAEALVAPTAPTPPNGAEPAAAGSPGAAVAPDRANAEVWVDSIPLPMADGLSPDTTGPGALVAILDFVVLVFLVTHQFADRRDPRLRAARDAEAVARFR